MSTGPITADRFLRHVLRSDGCWLWTGATSNRGYGQVGDDGKTRSTHKVAHELWIGPVPPGLTVDHTCHNADPACPGGSECKHRRCVNPAHLEAVTGGENVRRRLRDKCPNNHPYTPENTHYRPDTGRRVCRTCRKAQKQKTYKGYGKPGRPSKAAQTALAASRLADTG